MSKREITVRPARENEADEVSEWLAKNATRNGLDAQVFTYPTTRVYAAENDQTVMFCPVQTVAMMESLAPNPKAGDLERAEAIAQLVKGVVLLAHTAGIREVYFVGTDERINRIAERHGFEKLEAPVYRLKL